MTKQETKQNIKDFYKILIDNALEESRSEDAKKLDIEMKDQLKHWKDWR